MLTSCQDRRLDGVTRKDLIAHVYQAARNQSLMLYGQKHTSMTESWEKNAWKLLLKLIIKIYKLGFSNKLIVSILSIFFWKNRLVLVIKYLIDWVKNLNILTGLFWWFMKTDEVYWYLVKLNQTFHTNRLLIQLFELTFDHLSAK